MIRRSLPHKCDHIMDYVPWPESGCPFAEALLRIAESKPERPFAQADCSHYIDISEANIDDLKNGQLVAYGCKDGSNTPPELIVGSKWIELTSAEWQSLATDNRLERYALSNLRFYPALLAPCRVELLAGRTLAEAFSQVVLNDPEVRKLGREALRLSPQYEAVFVRGRCQIQGFAEWPLAFDRWVMVSTIHPDEDKRSIYDSPGEPDCLEVVVAAEALKHRYKVLISILREGAIEGVGFAPEAGHSERILRSIWTHEEFSLDAATGDVLQDNERSTSRYDRLLRRWIGVVLQQPSLNMPRAYEGARMFHGKPLISVGLPSTTSEPRESAQKSKSAARFEAKASSRKACEAWLVDVFTKSKDRRLYSRQELWKQAQSKWPGSLSMRQFLAARDEAIRSTGASVWGSPGAPKKSPHPNRSTD